MSTKLNRRDVIKNLGIGALIAGSGIINPLKAEESKLSTKGLPPLKITG
jgi:hypothetical protein